MGMTEQERRVILDYDRASAHSQKYIAPLLLQVQARGMMIESAARKFQAFSELPASSSTLLAFLDFAWSLVSTAVPALRLVGLVRKANIAAELTHASSAVRAVLIQHTSPGKVTRVTGRLGEVKDGADKVTGILGKGKAVINSDMPAVEAFAKLDTSKGPVKELFEDARKLVAAWSGTIDFLVEEKAARLANPTKTYRYTMASYASERLPIPEIFSGPELDQIETSHLWHMIGKYVRENVVYSGVGRRYSIHRGLNDTQIAAIYNLFAVTARRGRYFSKPVLPYNIFYYLDSFGASPRPYTAPKDTGKEIGRYI